MSGSGRRHLLADVRLPDVLCVEGRRLRLVRVLKWDFFAKTAEYRDRAGGACLKVQKPATVLGVPFRGFGVWMTRHEADLLRALAGVPGIPRYMGRWGRFGVLHEWIEGTDLKHAERIPDGFFDRFAAMLAAVHARGCALVDLNKGENIIVTADGGAGFVDFQLAFRHPGGTEGPPDPRRAWLHLLQREDWYHFLKHKSRHAGEQMTDAERRRARRSGWINLHRRIAQPLRRLRRSILRKADPTFRPGEERSRYP
jgi:hypothetical protein